MSLDTVIVAPFSRIYVGDADSTDPLVELDSDTEGGVTVTYRLPQEYHEVCGWIQSDRASIEAVVTFNTPTNSVSQLAMGNLPSANSFPDATPQFKELSILFQHPQGGDEDLSIYIPRCVVEKNWTFSANKDKNSNSPLKIIQQEDNKNTPLYYRRTNDDLDTVMGAKSPF
jgi:hypothetical protein